MDYLLDPETPEDGSPPDLSAEAFRHRVQSDTDAKQKLKDCNKLTKRQQKVQKQHSWRLTMKTTQRYLGIRPAPPQNLPPRDKLGDLTGRASYQPLSCVVFICVDVEAFEEDHSKILEIGVSTLDMTEAFTIPAGKEGIKWMEKISSRHFRLEEYAGLKNSKFVQGCPDRFNFGETEWVSRASVPRLLGELFKIVDPNAEVEQVQAMSGVHVGISGNLPPNGHRTDKGKAKKDDQDEDRVVYRDVILVGHGIQNDLNYLELLGFDVKTIPTLKGIIDTQDLWKALYREREGRSLSHALSTLGMTGWNCHNAGNDARYTLQVMLALAFRDLEPKDHSDGAATKRIEAAVEALRKKLWLEEEGWSSDDESINEKHSGPEEPVTEAPARTSTAASAPNGRRGAAVVQRPRHVHPAGPVAPPPAPPPPPPQAHPTFTPWLENGSAGLPMPAPVHMPPPQGQMPAPMPFLPPIPPMPPVPGLALSIVPSPPPLPPFLEGALYPPHPGSIMVRGSSRSRPWPGRGRGRGRGWASQRGRGGLTFEPPFIIYDD